MRWTEMKSHALLFISFRVLIVILKSLKVPQHELFPLKTNLKYSVWDQNPKVRISFPLKVISMVIQNLWQTGSETSFFFGYLKFKCPNQKEEIFCLKIGEKKKSHYQYCNIASTLLLPCLSRYHFVNIFVFQLGVFTLLLRIQLFFAII